jgi:hypothetical protein
VGWCPRSSGIRWQDPRARSRAKLRANDCRREESPGHVQPRSSQVDATSGDIRPRPATVRTHLTSEGSLVRIQLRPPVSAGQRVVETFWSFVGGTNKSQVKNSRVPGALGGLFLNCQSVGRSSDAEPLPAAVASPGGQPWICRPGALHRAGARGHRLEPAAPAQQFSQLRGPADQPAPRADQGHRGSSSARDTEVFVGRLYRAAARQPQPADDADRAGKRCSARTTGVRRRVPAGGL